MDCPDTPFDAVVHRIVRRLHAHPGDCALRFRGAGISNGALLAKILALADALCGTGIDAGMRVGVCLERDPALPVLLLALWWRGAVYVPLDPSFPRERLFTMCELAELDVLIAQASLQAVVDTLPCPALLLDALVFDTEAHLPMPLPVPDLPPAAEALAYILFTSGSSGAPKGVKISQGNLAALFDAILPTLQVRPGYRVLACANVCFDIGFFELLAPLLCGGTLVLADTDERATPAQLLRLIEQEDVTLVQATPSHWQLLTALPWTRSIPLALATGEALLRDTARAISEHAGVLWNLYGPTECTLWSSAHRVTPADLGDTAPAIVSIGSALPGYVLNLEPVNTEAGLQVDELVIGGNGVGQGYCGPQAHAAFIASPGGQRSYRSGDLCRHDAGGLLHYLGRLDSQVKHHGYRIEPEEIAFLLRQHMSVRQAVCLLRAAEAGRPSLLFACVVFRRGLPNRGKAQLNDYLATWLPEWMLPERYFFLDELPLNASGKLDRGALLALAAPGTSDAARNGGPDDLESGVAAIFREVLDVDTIGPCDSFLDAGGSSMLAATLVMTLNERLGSKLSLRDALATPPTVRRIVQLLRADSHREAS